MVWPRNSAVLSTSSRQARKPQKIPQAVIGDGSPPPPKTSSRPTPKRLSLRTRSISAGGGAPSSAGGRWISATAEDLVSADPEAAFFAYPFDIGGGRAHVLSGDVTASEGLNCSAQGAEQHLALSGGVIANDHPFATTVIESSYSGLERHRLSQTQSIGHGLGFAGIGPHADSTQRRS